MRKYLLIGIMFFWGGLVVTGCSYSKKNIGYTLPHLPYPIAKERTLVTVAGQGPEGLIVAKMCDTLKIANSYSYKANANDLEGKRSLIVVVGVSKIGLASVATDFTYEKLRVEKLVKKANEQHIPVIVLYLGETKRWDKYNQEMLKLLGKSANYIIAISEEREEPFFRDLASKNNVRFTLVKDIERVKIPLNSAFR